MNMKTMAWEESAWKAFVRAFSPMPPILRQRTMKKVAENIEKTAAEEGKGKVGLRDVHAGSKEILANKSRFMYNSLVEALRTEGYVAGES